MNIFTDGVCNLVSSLMTLEYALNIICWWKSTVWWAYILSRFDYKIWKSIVSMNLHYFVGSEKIETWWTAVDLLYILISSCFAISLGRDLLSFFSASNSWSKEFIKGTKNPDLKLKEIIFAEFWLHIVARKIYHYAILYKRYRSIDQVECTGKLCLILYTVISYLYCSKFALPLRSSYKLIVAFDVNFNVNMPVDFYSQQHKIPIFDLIFMI